jgi:replicative DNA helicase
VDVLIADHALELHRRGWCPLPLPAGAKWPPPEGRTGAAGVDYTADEIAEWTHDGNLGTRMPVGVVGIDVDQYGTKKGWDNLELFRERHGLDPLPPTRMVTSRDHPSGIRFYLIPEGVRLNGEACPDVEIIQRHHRYAVCAPTLHPDTGEPYQWIDTVTGEIGDEPPFLDDLTDLPTAWVEALRDRSTQAAERSPVTWDNPDAHSADWAPKVRAAHQRYAATGGSRHDAALKAVIALTRLDSFGLAGAKAAIEDIRQRFLAAVTTGDNQRDQRSAEAEWGRITDGAVDKVARTQPVDPLLGATVDPPPAQPDDPWPDAVPLQPPPPNPFPVHVLPDWVQAMVADVADTLQCAVDIPAQAAIGALSTVATGKLDVELAEGWTEPANLYLATAVPPSGGKSPTMKAVFGPVRDLEAELRQAARQSIAESDAQRKVLEKQLKEAEKNGDIVAMTQLSLDLSEPAPVPPRLLADDQTPEALGALLDQHRRISIVSSEGGMFTAMDRYTDGKAAQLDVYLKPWDGDDITIDRKGEPEPRIIRRPLMTICVTVQPTTILELGRKAEVRDRGWPHRFMYAVPASLVGGRDLATPRHADPVVRAAWADGITDIGRLLHRSQHPYRVRLDADAWAQFGAWRQHLEQQRGPGGDLEHLAEWTSKAEASVVRFAGLLWLADGATGQTIDGATMARAITVGQYWLSHAMHVWDAWAASADLDNARYALDAARQKEWPAITVRALMRRNDKRFPDADTTLRAIRVLVERGWVRPLVGAEGEWQVRPEAQTGPEPGLSTDPVMPVMPSLKYSEEELSIYLSTDRTSGPPGNGMTSMTAPVEQGAVTQREPLSIAELARTYRPDQLDQPSDWLPAMEEA